MNWLEIVAVFYYGGVVSASLSWLHGWVFRGEEQRRRHRDLGSPARSVVLSALLWPIFGLLTLLYYLADSPDPS